MQIDPMPIRLLGPTRRWRDGDRPNCRRSCKRRRKVFSAPDLYDSRTRVQPYAGRGIEREGIGAFFDPAFDPGDIAGYLRRGGRNAHGRHAFLIVR